MSDTEKQGMGCFAKGCLTVIVVCILLAAISVGGGYYYLKKFVTTLTSDKAVAIKVEQPTDAQMQAAAAKAQALTDAYNSGKEITVELTGPDLNALIARNPKLADYKGTMYFSIANSEVSGDVSVPLDAVPFDMFKKRFFNGRFVAFFELNNAEVTFKPKLIEANGRRVPDVVINQINSAEGQKQLNDELRKPNGKDLRNELSRFKSVRVVGDRLVIVTKAGPPPTK
jgi:hypothetical protein